MFAISVEFRRSNQSINRIYAKYVGSDVNINTWEINKLFVY